MKRPNFLIIGVGKSGTTSLAYYLSQHPDVFMSEPKEPWFFDGPEYERGMDFYWAKFFQGWNGERAVGEASSQNLYVPYVPQRIKESLPEAKLIAILRNPIERAYSDWWMKFSDGIERLSFNEAISEDLKRIEAGINFDGEDGKRLWHEHISCYRNGNLKFRCYLDYGYYARQLKRYLNLFDPSQIKIIFLEDLSRDPQAVARDLWHFLEVDPCYTLEDSKPQNVAYNSKAVRQFVKALGQIKVTKIAPKGLKSRMALLLSRIGEKPRMDPETRSWLIEHYYQHNRELEKLVGRDLSHWDR